MILTNIRAPDAPKSLGVTSLPFACLLKKMLGKISQEKYRDRKTSPPSSARVLAERLLPHRVVKAIQFSLCASAGGHHWYKGQNDSDFLPQNVKFTLLDSSTGTALVQAHTPPFKHHAILRNERPNVT